MSVEHPTIFCARCDYPLDGLTYDRCPECGTFFDLRDAATFNRKLPNAVDLYLPPTIMLAHLLRGLLEAEGIKAAVVGESLDAIMGNLPYMSTSAIVQVSSEDISSARAVLEQFIAAQEDQAGEPWRCGVCDEDVDDQFGVCWNCGSERPGEDGH